jgi:signal transduction histidine kinase
VNFSHTGNHLQHQEQGPVDIRACSQDAIDLLLLSDKENEIRFENNCDEHCIVLGDEQRLQQVFVNLLSNARDASPNNSVIRIESSVERHSINIKVIDEGTGIKAEQMEQIFDPFFTTKEVGMGTGLGLSVSFFIITNHHQGQMRVQSTLGSGTRFIIMLPLANTQTTTSEPAHKP